jgi:hypothetical protein
MSVPVERTIMTRRAKPRLASQALRVRSIGIRKMAAGGVRRGRSRAKISVVASRKRRIINKWCRTRKRKVSVNRGRRERVVSR